MIRTVEETITKYRDSEFEASFQEMHDLITEVSSMTPLKLPRQRVLGTADIKKHYRIQFLQFIDMISVELKARFSVEGKSVDLGKYRELCTVFKELYYMKLKAEATRFREVTGVSSLHEAKLAYRGMNDMERAFFPRVFEFMKILLACPVSSSTAERSFSALRRLKTWLRNSLSQERLNHNIIAMTHKDYLDMIKLEDVFNCFTSRTDIRKIMFGINKF